ncbi:MAG: hypothetical protein J3K34DRAFT_474359 [Monoraphidium minutum]|nr:MAG: hypothetical protein J3K34DRAFT_474359 [Monoraphidium minutum]
MKAARPVWRWCCFLAVTLLLLLLRASAAAVVRSDGSNVCTSGMLACQAKCGASDYFFDCGGWRQSAGDAHSVCACAEEQAAAGAAHQEATLVLESWTGADACNHQAFVADCAARLTVTVDGARVTLAPAAGAAAPGGGACPAVSGIVIGAQGGAAAVAFPGHPIGLVAADASGAVTLDFGRGGAGGALDWSRCVATYRVERGAFLGTQAAGREQQRRSAQRQQQVVVAA